MKPKNLLITIILIMILCLFVSGTHSKDVIKEKPLEVENWMSKPFDVLNEDTLELEIWMMKPFVIT